MSEDRFTEVSGESWFSRIIGAIKGIIFGLILFIVSFFLLFWNEGRAVRTYKTLKEGGKIAVSVPCDRVDAANAGKLVHLTGRAECSGTLADSVFGVSAPALKLQRTVEMYQWKESKSSKTQKKFGGGTETVTTYDYSRVWSAQPLDSSTFKLAAEHKNPGSMPYESRELRADPIRLGAFQLSRPLVDCINNYTPLEVPPTAPLPAELQGKAWVANGGFYIGGDPAAPQIGDLRVSFRKAEPTEVSVIARQINNTFEPYLARAGGKIEILQTGTYSIEEMIRTAQQNNQVLTWVLRGLGFLLMFMGLGLILNPLSVIADIVPFIGSLVGAGTGLIAFLLAATLSLLTVATAWIVYRPLLGIALLAAALGVATLIRKKIRKKQPSGVEPAVSQPV